MAEEVNNSIDAPKEKVEGIATEQIEEASNEPSSDETLTDQENTLDLESIQEVVGQVLVNGEGHVEEESDDPYGFDEPLPGPDYVGMTLQAGVTPLELRYSQINSPQSRNPIAYRAQTFINSVITGVITPEQYNFAADDSTVNIQLARYNILSAIATIRKLREAGRKFEFVTARISPKIAVEVDTYEWLKNLFNEVEFTIPEKLCIEFPQSLFFEDQEKVNVSILNMKLLKVKTLITGYGATDCPMINITKVPVDYVMLEPSVTEMAGSRSNDSLFQSILSFLSALEINIIADGVYNDTQITALRRSDCFGYIPSSGYKGEVKHGLLRMTLKEAIAQKEEGEEQ